MEWGDEGRFIIIQASCRSRNHTWSIRIFSNLVSTSSLFSSISHSFIECFDACWCVSYLSLKLLSLFPCWCGSTNCLFNEICLVIESFSFFSFRSFLFYFWHIQKKTRRTCEVELCDEEEHRKYFFFIVIDLSLRARRNLIQKNFHSNFSFINESESSRVLVVATRKINMKNALNFVFLQISLFLLFAFFNYKKSKERFR
jgi:hypothetical protein